MTPLESAVRAMIDAERQGDADALALSTERAVQAAYEEVTSLPVMGNVTATTT